MGATPKHENLSSEELVERIGKEAIDLFQSHGLPGMIMTAQDKTGKVNFTKCIGTAPLNADAKQMEVDTTFWLASMSKLVTSIAALQSVDRGYFTLDEDVTRILPEWKDVRILKAFDEETGEPILVPAKNKITLRFVPLG